MKGYYRHELLIGTNDEATKLVIVVGLLLNLSVVAVVNIYVKVSPVNTGTTADEINNELVTGGLEYIP